MPTSARSNRPSPSPGTRVSGFTLIEIVVAIAVAALLFGVVVSQVESGREREMRRAARQLAQTIRYLYNKAAMEKIYIRLVLDLEERSYWVEATADPVVVAREGTARGDRAKEAEKEKKKEGEKKEEAKKEEEKGEGGEAAGKEGEKEKEGEAAARGEKLKVPEPKFGQVDAYLLKPTKLPDEVFFKDLQVEHRRGPVEGGQESIYFFPNGYVERAIVNLRDEDDEVHYSLVTHPISGKVDVEDRYQAMGER